MIQGLSLQDTLFNWLTIQIVADKKTDDTAAQETCKEFITVLQENHQVTDLSYEKQDDLYVVKYKKDDEEEQKQFPTELAESLIQSIEDQTFFIPGLDDK